MIPLYGFLKGDTLGLLILAQEEDTIEQLAARLVQAARLRVVPSNDVDVRVNGRLLRSDSTVQREGLRPLEKFEVARRLHA